MFTRQELIYLAMGARSLAKLSRADRDAQSGHSISSVFESAAKAYDELAKKCERLADSMPE